jgi:hypothetical protein
MYLSTSRALVLLSFVFTHDYLCAIIINMTDYTIELRHLAHSTRKEKERRQVTLSTKCTCKYENRCVQILLEIVITKQGYRTALLEEVTH